MPDASDLYPKPPGGGGNALLSDPAKALGLLSAAQEYRLRGEQFNALSQQPQAALTGQNTQNVTSQMEQNEKASQIAAHYFGSLPDDASTDDVYRMKMAIRAVHPNISGQTINTVADVALRDKKGIRNGIATLRLMGVPATEQVGRVPGPPTVEGAPTSVTQSQAARAPAIQTGLSPREQAAQTATGAGAGSIVNDARVHGLNFNQQIFPLEQAIPALEKLGTKGTGPGTESVNHLKSFVLSNIPGANFEGMKDEVATYDKAKKYLTDFVNQNGNTSTNDKLAAAFAGNPSVNISNAAAVDVAKSALALRRFKQAQLVAFEKSNKPDEDFPKEAGKWARDRDVRVYGFDMMSPEQRKKVIESLPAGKREMFMMDVQDALANGIIKPPK